MSARAKKYWNNHAVAWDSIYLDESRIARRLNQALRKAIYERFHVALTACDLRGKTVLDVGCGSGRLVIEALKRGAARAVGLDFAPRMLEIAREAAAREAVAERSEFVHRDFLRFDTDERFDLVVANGFFDYTEDPEAVLEKMIELSRAIVVASFPGKSFVRNWLRRIRYGIQGCPVFFYGEERIRRYAMAVGLQDYELKFIPHSGTGFMLVGRVDRSENQ